MTFDEAMVFTEHVSEDWLFTREECEGMWTVLQQVPAGGTVVEIGCMRGRSSSLILQAARERGFLSIHIDPWTTGEGAEWMQMAHAVQVPFVVLKMKSEEALALPWLSSAPLDLVFIDGDHETPAVRIDTRWGDRLRPGGILCAHDFGRDYLSGVESTLREYTRSGWGFLGVQGTFASWRKLETAHIVKGVLQQ